MKPIQAAQSDELGRPPSTLGEMRERLARALEISPWPVPEPVGPVCDGCGGRFEPVRPGQRHCRPTCRRLSADRSAAKGGGLFE